MKYVIFMFIIIRQNFTWLDVIIYQFPLSNVKVNIEFSRSVFLFYIVCRDTHYRSCSFWFHQNVMLYGVHIAPIIGSPCATCQVLLLIGT